MKEPGDLTKQKPQETFRQFVPVRNEAKHSYIPHENIQEAQFDRFSDGNSSIPNFSPRAIHASPGFSNFTSSITNSPFLLVQKAIPHLSFDQKERREVKDPYNDYGRDKLHQKSENLCQLFIDKKNQEQTLNPIQAFGSQSRQREAKNIDQFPLKHTKAAQSYPQDNNQSDSISIDNPAESEDEGNMEKKKLNKGLKLLSVIVRDIVIEKQSTTYKEVAEIILKDTIKDEHLNTSHKTEILKEEQNIKRRVYDALNVLISAGILIKDGKRVRKNENVMKIKINIKRSEINSMYSKFVF
jgi:hypothetical protein